MSPIFVRSPMGVISSNGVDSIPFNQSLASLSSLLITKARCLKFPSDKLTPELRVSVTEFDPSLSVAMICVPVNATLEYQRAW